MRIVLPLGRSPSRNVLCSLLQRVKMSALCDVARCRLLALLRHAVRWQRRLFMGVERKSWVGEVATSAFGPISDTHKLTNAAADDMAAPLT
jgi:hypothetical protein